MGCMLLLKAQVRPLPQLQACCRRLESSNKRPAGHVTVADTPSLACLQTFCIQLGGCSRGQAGVLFTGRFEWGCRSAAKGCRYSKMGSDARQPITPTRTRCQRFGRLDGLLTTLQPLLA